MSLSDYAEPFASAGYSCIVFDYRRWGASDGTRRHTVFVSEQQDDYRTVIDYARSRPDLFDAARVVLWGYSFSGGHVITLSDSLQNLGIAATIGISPYAGRPFPFLMNKLYFTIMFLSLMDYLCILLRLKGIYIPAVAPPGEVAALTQMGAVEGFRSLERNPGDFPNQIGASIAIRSPFYKASKVAHRILTPFLFIAPEKDTIRSAKATIDLSRVPPRAELLRITGGHFDMFSGGVDYDASLAAQLEFLKRHVPID